MNKPKYIQKYPELWMHKSGELSIIFPGNEIHYFAENQWNYWRDIYSGTSFLDHRADNLSAPKGYWTFLGEIK